MQEPVQNSENMTATDAKSMAQWIAFAPFAFQATVLLRDAGVLETLAEQGGAAEPSSLAEHTDLSEYAVSLLLEFGEHLGLVEESDGAFSIGPVGIFVLNDEMTRINLNFTRDVSYDALPYLKESFDREEPVGLSTLGPWDTLYDGLSDLPEPAKTSWHEFDHFYSKQSADELVPVVFEEPVDTLLDVGGNNGVWAREFLEHDPEVSVHILDLPSVLEDARENLDKYGLSERVTFVEQDLRDEPVQFPRGTDVIWMSQLLDCFPPEWISVLLSAARDAMNRDTRLLIVEMCPDRQEFEAAAFSLDAISLYFTCVANGKSRFYRFDQLREFIRDAGLTIDGTRDVRASGHTLISCRPDD